MIISVVLGILMGIISAVTRGKLIDRLCTILSVTGISIPVFLSGLVFLYIFAVKLRWFPASASSPIMLKNPLLAFILPAFTLGIRSAAFLARIV